MKGLATHLPASGEMFVPDTVLVTGGSGFLGANLVRWLLARPEPLRVVNLDALTYAAAPGSLAEVEAAHGAAGDGRYFFVHGDVRDARLMSELLRGGAAEPASGRRMPRPDAVLHLAAESHVDRSILEPAAVVDTNVRGAITVFECSRLELARRPRAFRVVVAGTDEVYGSLEDDTPPATEAAPLAPNNPYAASKASADLIARSYARTFGLPILITRASNTFGPYQFPEKLIPLFVIRAMRDEPLPVFGDGLNRRGWLHADDHASAIWTVCTRGSLRDLVYNVRGSAAVSNLDVAYRILAALNKPESLLRFVPDRAAHDRRYAVDDGRVRSDLGWSALRPFEGGLEDTVRWYVEHERWWRPLLGEAYRSTEALYLPREGVR